MNKVWLTRLKIGEMNLENIEKYVRSQGWDLEYYGNDNLLDRYIESLGATECAAHTDAFTYRDHMKVTIFVRYNCSQFKKMSLLLHEIGHIVLGHNIRNLNEYEEYEADYFAIECQKAKSNAKPILITALVALTICVIFFTLIQLGNTSAIRPANTSDNQVVTDSSDSVYITPSGNKFHRNDCVFVENRNDIVQLDRNEAIAMNKEPCQVCKP